MKLTDFIPLNDSFGELKGVEKQLRTRRFKGTLSLWASILSAVAYALASSKNLPFLGNTLTNAAKLLHIEPHVAFAIVLAGVCVWVFLRYTGFLFKESNEPFRYTFSVGEFKQVKNTPDTRFAVDQMDQLSLLRLDLIERLNRRVRRFSMLDSAKAGTADGAGKPLSAGSHFQIEGDFAVREDESDGWIVHVWPRVRIGVDGNAYALAYPVRLPIGEETPTKGVLDLDEYQRLVERVYSSVATEIYKQIEVDLCDKMKLFPTNSLRALARYVEAEDFETSNTIDAYDRALEMYQSSLDELDASLVHSAMRWLGQYAWGPVVSLSFTGIRTRMEAEAKTKVGYSRCLVYRRMVSEMGGRQRNPIYRCREYLQDALGLLARCYDSFLLFEPTPRHQPRAQPQSRSLWQITAWVTGSPLRLHPEIGGATEPTAGTDDPHTEKMVLARSAVRWSLGRKRLYQQVRKELCEAYAVAALAYSKLDDTNKAQAFIRLAEALSDRAASDQPENSASARVPVLLLFAKAELEPTLDQRIIYLTIAKELNPESEIALYRFAYNSDLLARDRNDITAGRVRQINREYQAVLNVNPANIASIIGQGYLFWLVEDLDSARTKLRAGIELQKIVAKTFVGDLRYCLARVEAERAFGRMENPANNVKEEGPGQMLLNAAMDYEQATVADPSVAAGWADSQSRSRNVYYYERVNSQMLVRYRSFVQRTSATPPKAISGQESLDRALTTVRSYSINDEGNAQLSYYLRFEVSTGKTAALSEALRLSAAAWLLSRDNCMLEYNYFMALRQASDDKSGRLVDEIGQRLLDNSDKLPPACMVVVINQLLQRDRSRVINLDAEKTRQQAALNKLKDNIKDLTTKIEHEKAVPHRQNASQGQAAGGTAVEDAVSPAKPSQNSEARADRDKAPHYSTPPGYNVAGQRAPDPPDRRAGEAPPGTTNAADTEAPAGSGIAAKEVVSPDRLALEDKQRREKDAETRLKKTDAQLSDAIGDLSEHLESFQEKMRKSIVNKTRLAPFAELIRPETIRELLGEPIDWYDFGDIEVFALFSFASIWASASMQTPNDSKRTLQLKESSRQLYDRITRLYSPENFDANWDLFGLAQGSEEKTAFLETANKAVDWSRKYDSQSCFFRQWSYATFGWKLSVVYPGWPDTPLGDTDCESLLERYRQVRKDCEGQPDFHDAFADAYERWANAWKGPGGNPHGREILEERRHACTLDRNNRFFLEKYLDCFGHQLISRSTWGDPLSGRTATEIELAADLINALGFDSSTDLPPEIKTITELRHSLRDFGFELPGITFRYNGSLAAGCFRFILRGVPMPEERLSAAPRTEQWSKLKEHIETLALMQYHQRKVADDSEIQDDPKALWALNHVLKSLLRENVPVVDFDSILQEFLRCRRAGFGIMTTIGEIRALPQIRKILNGNSVLDGETVEYLASAPPSREPRKTLVIARPDPDLQSLLDAAVDWDALEPIFVTSTRLVEDLRVLARKAKDQASSQGRAVLVVSSSVRPFCRKLIADRDVSILSDREILPTILSQIKDPNVTDAKGSPTTAGNQTDP